MGRIKPMTTLRITAANEDDPGSPARPTEWRSRSGTASYLTRATASISTLTSFGRRAAWTVARAGLGALKNSA